MNRTTSLQYTVAGTIYGVIALLLLACALVGVYGAFNGGRPELILIAGIFGMLGCFSTFASLYGFNRAMVRS